MIYLIKDFRNIPIESTAYSFKLSPSEELRINNKRKNEQSIYARYAASIGIEKEFGIERSEITFGCSPSGKPIAQNTDICLSITHSGNAVAAGVSTSPIGIDIEYTRPCKEKIVEKYFSSSEKKHLSNARNIDIAFTEIWVLKESIAKLTGLGLSNVISNTNLSVDDNKFVSEPFNCYLKTFTIDNLVIGCAFYNSIPNDYIYFI